MPGATVRKVVTPYVLKCDKEACKHIVERLKADQIADEYRQNLMMQSRQETRQRFLA